MSACLHRQEPKQVGPALPGEGPVIDIVVRNGSIYVIRMDSESGRLETLVLMADNWIPVEAGHA